MTHRLSSVSILKYLGRKESLKYLCTSCTFLSKAHTTHSCSFNQPPLTKKLPNIPDVLYRKHEIQNMKTNLTELPCGMRVVSELAYGDFCTVGVAINSGSRYEIAYPSGVNHFLEKLAFKSTSNFPEDNQVLVKIEKYGSCKVNFFRDVALYSANIHRKYVDNIIKVLADVVLRPRITDNEMLQARKSIIFEHDKLLKTPDQNVLLDNLVHMVAYQDNTLGLSKICPLENFSKINHRVLLTYLKNHYIPERIVIGGVGVDHQQLVNSVQKYFIDKKPIWNNERLDKISIDTSKPIYTGGVIKQKHNIPEFRGKSGSAALSHAVIGLECVSLMDTYSLIPSCVLNLMMGGGDSFSTGGPGKGMYTRLYRNVLSRYPWLNSAISYNNIYTDSGFFCIHASTISNYVQDMIKVIVYEISNMANSIQIDELARAKKQVRSYILMDLESRNLQWDDMVTQILAWGFRKPPEEFLREIENITEEDIVKVVKKMHNTPLTVVACGNIEKLPKINDMQELINAKPKIKNI